MSATKSIMLSELRGLTDQVFDFLAKAGIEHVPVNQNFYWTIAADAAFTSIEPPSPSMGDILDDLSDLRSEVVDQTPETTAIIWHAFEHLSGLMKFVAYADLGGQLTSEAAKGG